MATLVTFYALEEPEYKRVNEDASDNKHATFDATNNVAVKKAAELTLAATRNRVKTTILCSTQAQAEELDEFIWQYPQDSFIPHNLFGEGPAAGTPAEIIWQSAYASMSKLRNRALVINLSGEFIDAYAQLGQIIDFVPVEEQAKADARTRYKQYKQAGCQLEYKNA